MWIIAVIIILVLVFAFFRSGHRVGVRANSRGVIIRPRIVRHTSHPVYRTRMIRRVNTPPPATLCGHPKCGKLSVVCRRDEADATHATGMKDPRKKR